MIIKDINLQMLDYPVGVHMRENLLRIDSYVNIIQKYFSGKTISLIVTGSSGSIIAGVIASKIPCEIIYVRKDGEKSHSAHSQTPIGEIQIVVDDIVSTGQTVKRILNAYPNKNFDALIFSGTFDETEVVFDINRFTNIFCQY